jgi:hypothetical protein
LKVGVSHTKHVVPQLRAGAVSTVRAMAVIGAVWNSVSTTTPSK